MGDYGNWTLSALKATCRRLYKDSGTPVQKEIDAQTNINELAKLVYAKQGGVSQDPQYHNWRKESLIKEADQLQLPTTGSKATLIAHLTNLKKKKDTSESEESRTAENSHQRQDKRKKLGNDDDGADNGEDEDVPGHHDAKKHKNSNSNNSTKAKSTLKLDQKSKEHHASPTQSNLPLSSPAKRLRSSPLKGGDSAKSKLKFAGVEVRQYERRHGGGGGVPHNGGYPLGLDWEYDKEHVLQRGLTDYEEMRKEERHTKGNIPAVSEKERQELLLQADNRTSVERASSFTKQKSDLDKLRKIRKDIGCHCTGSECGTLKCNCNKSGVECLEDYCSCTNCENPQNM
eukprot:Phypoly_transcript_10329.p1 GENE.Phypoly_transcript_10329~~Phypoly_transcript_10329.p1  ORF type:complete len:344 (+),score=45.63 Phypoly_transcript_10329:125-1156(+)